MLNVFIYVEKASESEGCVDQKAVDGERNESRTNKCEEPEKPEEKNGNQGKKDGKNKQCKHKREKELGEQGKPKTDVQDKDEMNSKEREQSESFSDTVLIVLNNKVDMGMIGVIAEYAATRAKLKRGTNSPSCFLTDSSTFEVPQNTLVATHRRVSFQEISVICFFTMEIQAVSITS